MSIQLQDRSLTLHGAVVCVCGDIPASNYIGGFKEGVAFALRKCRSCLATAHDMRAKVCYLKHMHIHMRIYIRLYITYLKQSYFSGTLILEAS